MASSADTDAFLFYGGSMATELVCADADVRAILADPSYLVPPAPPSDEVGTLAWLRAHVARFCDGEVHDRRRALVQAEIARLDPARLRQRAAGLTTEELTRGQNDPLDAMTIARRVPAAVRANVVRLADDAIGAAGATQAVGAPRDANAGRLGRDV